MCSTLMSSSPFLNKYYDYQIFTIVTNNQNIKHTTKYNFGFDFWGEKSNHNDDDDDKEEEKDFTVQLAHLETATQYPHDG